MLHTTRYIRIDVHVKANTLFESFARELRVSWKQSVMRIWLIRMNTSSFNIAFLTGGSLSYISLKYEGIPGTRKYCCKIHIVKHPVLIWIEVLFNVHFWEHLYNITSTVISSFECFSNNKLIQFKSELLKTSVGCDDIAIQEMP